MYVTINNFVTGWVCSDDSYANSYATILVELLLLVLSNLAFLPAVYFAYKRRYYVEAIVYASTCFFSTFYHACDAGENIVSFCITNVSVLQFSDFFTALLGIWVTLIALANLPYSWPSILHMSGAICIAFGSTLNRRSLWAFLIPAVVGVLIVIVRWGLYYRQKRFLPVTKKYLYRNLPVGLVLVVVGLIVYAALQTESNYKYTHSFWHVVMAAAVIILLPTKDMFLPQTLF